MSYWVIIAEQGSPIPVGTTRVVHREVLSDGRVKWVVEGAEFMNVLAGIVNGIISVRRYDPLDDDQDEGQHSVA